DYLDANGTRVVGMDFASTASVAAGLQGILGISFTVSSAGTSLTVIDDGLAATSDVGSLTGHATATALQNSVALNLFVDYNDADFTNCLSGSCLKLGIA